MRNSPPSGGKNPIRMALILCLGFMMGGCNKETKAEINTKMQEVREKVYKYVTKDDTSDTSGSTAPVFMPGKVTPFQVKACREMTIGRMDDTDTDGVLFTEADKEKIHRQHRICISRPWSEKRFEKELEWSQKNEDGITNLQLETCDEETTSKEDYDECTAKPWLGSLRLQLGAQLDCEAECRGDEDECEKCIAELTGELWDSPPKKRRKSFFPPKNHNPRMAKAEDDEAEADTEGLVFVIEGEGTECMEEEFQCENDGDSECCVVEDPECAGETKKYEGVEILDPYYE